MADAGRDQPSSRRREPALDTGLLRARSDPETMAEIDDPHDDERRLNEDRPPHHEAR